MKINFMFFGKNHANKHFCMIFIFLLLVLNPSKVFAQTFNASPPPSDNAFPAPARYEFSKGMSIIFVLIVVVFFMMGCFSVYGRQCIESRSGSSRGLLMINEVNRRSRRAGHGLEPDVIDTFPTFLYSDVKKVKIGSLEGLECAICLNEFKDEEILRMLPKCCHVFHPECIDTWLISHVTCPVCRADLVPVPGETGTNSCNLLNRDAEDETTHINEEGGGQVHEVNEMAIEIDSVTNNQRQSFEGKFPRSHSTGHSLIQPSNNYERFTLRLPQDVQKKLMKPEFRRAKSNLVLPSESSAKKGYRSSSVGAGHQQNHNNYERFDHDGGQERWGFTMAPPFFTRSRSIPTPKGDDNRQMTSENSTKDTKSPYDNGLFGGSSGNDDIGERSFVKLIGNSQV